MYNGHMARARKSTYHGPKRVIGYVRVSTSDQAESGAGLEAQRRAIIAECERNGWTLVRIAEDAGLSAKDMNRPSLTMALEELKARKADMLLVSKLDRLSRSVRDVCTVGDMAAHYGFDLAILDAKIDTSSPHGRAQLQMMSVFAELERNLIGARTREALKVKASQGVKIGRPRVVASETLSRVHGLRASGMTLRAIADQLTADGVPTPQGGQRWHVTTVTRALEAVA